MGLDERSTNQISGIPLSLKTSTESGVGKRSHCEVGRDKCFHIMTLERRRMYLTVLGI